MKTIRIDRSKWLTGSLIKLYAKYGQTIISALLDEETQTMCCLGFYAQQCGVPKAALINVSSPATITQNNREHGKKMSTLLAGDFDADQIYFSDTDIADALMLKNDDQNLTPKKREATIKAGFAKAGIKVVFHGKYPTAAQIKAKVEKMRSL